MKARSIYVLCRNCLLYCSDKGNSMYMWEMCFIKTYVFGAFPFKKSEIEFAKLAPQAKILAKDILLTLPASVAACFGHCLLRSLPASVTACFGHCLLRSLRASVTTCFGHCVLRS